VKGGEQAGTRPVIVISAQMMTVRSMRVIVCPITSNMQPSMTKIGLPVGLKTKGTVLADQIRAIDKKERLLRRVEGVQEEFLLLLRSYVGRLLDFELPFADR
jgi:mRNA interferase MazF